MMERDDLAKENERLKRQIENMELTFQVLVKKTEEAVKHAQEMERKMHSMRVEMERMKLDVKEQEERFDRDMAEEFEGYGDWA